MSHLPVRAGVTPGPVARPVKSWGLGENMASIYDDLTKVPKRVRESVSPEELAYWHTITEVQRGCFYTDGRTDVMDGVSIHLNYGDSHYGESVGPGSGSIGRGESLRRAIMLAYMKRPEAVEAERAAHEALRKAPVTCWKCGDEYPGDSEHIIVYSSGKSPAICSKCCWEHYPESAKMLNIPRPDAAVV